MEIIIRPSLKQHFDPAVWNNTSRLGVTNCYTYALDAQDCSWLTLGALSSGGWQLEDRQEQSKWGTEEGLRELAIRDGLIPVSESDANLLFHTVAIMGAKITTAELEFCEVSSSYFHCMRLHPDETMSEKYGVGPVVNETISKQPMTLENYKTHFNQVMERARTAQEEDIRIRNRVISHLMPKTGPKITNIAFAGFFTIPEQGLKLQLHI